MENLYMNRLQLILILFLIQTCIVVASTSYINCTYGTLNVILTAPHGGYEEPASVPNRDAGCYVNGECVWSHSCGAKDTSRCKATTVRDSYTKELTELLAVKLEAALGKPPTTVINNLRRTKLDANRDVNQATFGETIPTEAFYQFHACINESKARIEADSSYNGMGLLLDIHGHGHPNNWAELGYLFSGSKLDSNNIPATSSSIKHLASVFQGEFETLLRGNLSFGHYLETEGYETVPSPNNTGPNGASYFSGGYNTKWHGSLYGGKIDAIQIESSYANRVSSERDNYATGITNAVVKYLSAHYPQLADTTTSSNPSNSDTGYINCTEGKLNVILAAPHGGYLEPAEIPNRDAGCYINGACVWSSNCGAKDTTNCRAITERHVNTKELTEMIADNLEHKLGLRPTTVVNNLKRIKLDADEPMDKATFGNAIVTQAWEEYHKCINDSKSRIETDSTVNGMGLFLDIHGQSHQNNWAILGYLLSADDLENNNLESTKSSIKHLASLQNTDFETIVRGNKSFGYYLQREGYDAVPSSSYGSPNGQSYISGSYSIQMHGSLSGGKIDGIRIGSSSTNRDQGHISDYAKAVTEAIVNFRKSNYEGSDVNSGCSSYTEHVQWIMLMNFVYMLYIIQTV